MVSEKKIFEYYGNMHVYSRGAGADNPLGQGRPKVMIYINFVELLSMMLHAKFQNRRASGFGEDDS